MMRPAGWANGFLHYAEGTRWPWHPNKHAAHIKRPAHTPDPDCEPQPERFSKAAWEEVKRGSGALQGPSAWKRIAWPRYTAETGRGGEQSCFHWVSCIITRSYKLQLQDFFLIYKKKEMCIVFQFVILSFHKEKEKLQYFLVFLWEIRKKNLWFVLNSKEIHLWIVSYCDNKLAY